MKVHPVFHARFLHKDPNDPLEGQVNPPLEPLVIKGNEEWEVEDLVAIWLKRGKLHYKAKWLGANKDPNYYPIVDFIYSPHVLRDFHLKHPELPRPPQ